MSGISPTGQWRSWARRLSDGEEDVVAVFWQQYGPRLQALAAEHIGRRLARREGPEDVVQSACRTFFRRAREGQFSLSDREGLWRLLCAITLTKIREKARFHGRQRRNMSRETPLESPREQSDSLLPGIAAEEPTPAEVIEFAEHLEQLLGLLEPEERQLVELKLEDCTNEEAAARMGCSERTVRRMLKRVQARLGRLLEESIADGIPPP